MSGLGAAYRACRAASLTAVHSQLPVFCPSRGPLWSANAGGRFCPLVLMHWDVCGGRVAHHCWTVLYHGASDPTTGLGGCVQRGRILVPVPEDPLPLL